VNTPTGQLTGSISIFFKKLPQSPKKSYIDQKKSPEFVPFHETSLMVSFSSLLKAEEAGSISLSFLT
jgi:hypothetical protein